MNRILIKTIFGGAILGAALFFLPFFVLKVAVVFLLFGLFFRLFGRHRGGYRGPYGWAYADKIRGMNDEEYSAFKERMASRRCGYPRKDSNVENKTEES